MPIDAKTIKRQKATLSVSEHTIIIAGIIDEDTPEEFMIPFFEEVHSSIVENEIREVEVDLKNLVFLNSSGIKSFVRWIIKLKELDEDKRYTIIFSYDPDIPWQESSIQALILLDEDLLKMK